MRPVAAADQEACKPVSQAAQEAMTKLDRATPPRLRNESESSGEDDGSPFPDAALGPDGLPSRGSAGHAAGECKRCCFFPKGRCGNGHECNFCHFDHDRRRRLKKKKKRAPGGSELPSPSCAVGPVQSSPTGKTLVTSAVATVRFNGDPALSLVPTPQSAAHLNGHRVYPAVSMTPTAPPPAPPLLARLALDDTPPPPVAALEPAEVDVGSTGVAAPSEGVAEACIMPSLLATTVTSTSRSPPVVGAVNGSNLISDMAASAQLGLLLSPADTAPDPTGEQHAATPWSNAQCDDGQGGTLPWPLAYGVAYSADGTEWVTYDMGSGMYPSDAYDTSAAMQGHLPMLPLQLPSVAGMEKDSPRSALLTMCGAWGALSSIKSAEGKAATEEPEPRSYGRDEMLAIRNAAKRGRRPAPLRSLHTAKTR